uniref:DNA mismatch repair proteins mutS family domain-containing protein n=1 Tax=Phlebotomus papatasi TaxID=29031 RepID=A0A1B0DQ33_PHLPP
MLPDKLLKIHQGRHALMEERVNFIPNDIHVSESMENLITIITAPNSAGKSIYLKQVGIIVYLAHIGCFVPATSAEIGIIDSIYSRIHNIESIHQDASSFFHDLHQMANVMENSSTRSLILIDEFGSGTNVNEGKSLLVACIEELSKRCSAAPITLFSTHYLDIVDLCESREMVKEITIESTFDDSGRLQTTHKIVDGRCPLQYANELHNIRRSLENQETFTDERLEDEVEKKLYLETHIQPHQKLVIQSAGNLLRYMDTNWKAISTDNMPPIISSLKVFSLKSQVLIDDSTYLALEIFSTATHPSGFMKGLKGAEQMGFSLYRLLNQCQSKIGSDELKMILQQPTNDISELNKRYDTIEWCLNQQNTSIVVRLKRMMKQVYEISRCFKKILENPDKMYFWKIFRSSVAHAYKICELCRDSVREGENSGLIEELGEAVKDQVEIMVVFMAITEIVDIDEGMQENKFIVQEGFDVELDNQKDYLRKIQMNIPEVTQAELRKYFPVFESCEYTMVPEMGFVIAIKSPMASPSDSSSGPGMGSKFLFQTNDLFYYSTPCCMELNDKYGHMYNDICENESLLAINQDLSEEYEHLLSLCWDSATLSASFYVIQTMEMFIVPEITDLRPMFSYTHNLFRQLNPIAVMASGHESFLREVMTLLKLPEDANPKDYTATAIHGTSEPNNFMVFPQSEKSMLNNRQRLWSIKISGTLTLHFM